MARRALHAYIQRNDLLWGDFSCEICVNLHSSSASSAASSRRQLPTGAVSRPGWAGVATETGLPIEWSADKNIVWKLALPGPGTSSPVTVGNRIFLTCYSGYALDTKERARWTTFAGICSASIAKTGKTAWTKVFDPVLPEHKYAGEGAYHGYAASTAASDGERLYVFFGKSGVYASTSTANNSALSRRQGDQWLGFRLIAVALQESRHHQCQR